MKTEAYFQESVPLSQALRVDAALFRSGKHFSPTNMQATAGRLERMAEQADQLERLAAEVEHLRALCGCAYQMAGLHDAPVNWLDALGDAANGVHPDQRRVKGDVAEALLPYRPEPGDAPTAASFQERVSVWLLRCFSQEVADDIIERGDRFLEESLELLQSKGYDPARVPTLVDYVYGRPVGEPRQEVGGVMVTLAAFCRAIQIGMQAAGEQELARIEDPATIEKIRIKQASKRGIHTPLPSLPPP